MFKKMGTLAQTPQKKIVKSAKNSISFPLSMESIAIKKALGPQSMLLVSFMKVLMDNGDDEDFSYFLNECAVNFFENLIDEKTVLMWTSQDNIELVVDEFNRIMLTNNLGYIQVTVSEDTSGEIDIILYDSLIKRTMSYLNKDNFTCNIFYESFFSLFLSSLFQEKISVTSVSSQDEEICYYKAAIGA